MSFVGDESCLLRLRMNSGLRVGEGTATVRFTAISSLTFTITEPAIISYTTGTKISRVLAHCGRDGAISDQITANALLGDYGQLSMCPRSANRPYQFSTSLNRKVLHVASMQELCACDREMYRAKRAARKYVHMNLEWLNGGCYFVLQLRCLR
jgi:hypothetical protein